MCALQVYVCLAWVKLCFTLSFKRSLFDRSFQNTQGLGLSALCLFFNSKPCKKRFVGTCSPSAETTKLPSAAQVLHLCGKISEAPAFRNSQVGM